MNSETLAAFADDLRAVRIVTTALPRLSLPDEIRDGIQTLVNAVLDTDRLLLLKAAIRSEQAEREECGE